MNDRRCFESLDRTLWDLLDEPNRLFGGKTVMLGGDFRQTLPMKKSSSKNKVIQSSVTKSYIWRHFKIHYLRENMCLKSDGLQEADKERVSTFAQWLLDVGNENIGTQDESDPENSSWIYIPDQYRIPNDENRISNLINFIYDDGTLQYPSAVKLHDKAIICHTNDTADAINAKIMSLLFGTTHTYISYHDAIPHGHDGGEVELLYPRERIAAPSNSDSTREAEGNMIITEPEITTITDLRPIHYNKTIEAVMYHMRLVLVSHNGHDGQGNSRKALSYIIYIKKKHSNMSADGATRSKLLCTSSCNMLRHTSTFRRLRKPFLKAHAKATSHAQARMLVVTLARVTRRNKRSAGSSYIMGRGNFVIVQVGLLEFSSGFSLL
nr:DNA helicase [Tanacetum cinerariifolium]